jgi:hypothetical protein
LVSVGVVPVGIVPATDAGQVVQAWTFCPFMFTPSAFDSTWVAMVPSVVVSGCACVPMKGTAQPANAGSAARFASAAVSDG